jgi:hypothetical protein
MPQRFDDRRRMRAWRMGVFCLPMGPHIAPLSLGGVRACNTVEINCHGFDCRSAALLI